MEGYNFWGKATKPGGCPLPFSPWFTLGGQSSRGEGVEAVTRGGPELQCPAHSQQPWEWGTWAAPGWGMPSDSMQLADTLTRILQETDPERPVQTVSVFLYYRNTKQVLLLSWTCGVMCVVGIHSQHQQYLGSFSIINTEITAISWSDRATWNESKLMTYHKPPISYNHFQERLKGRN